MLNLKQIIVLVTVLLFIYNAFFTYIIINFTIGVSRFVFLILISFDYIIIFYFILSIAAELRKEGKLKRGSRIGMIGGSRR